MLPQIIALLYLLLWISTGFLSVATVNYIEWKFQNKPNTPYLTLGDLFDGNIFAVFGPITFIVFLIFLLAGSIAKHKNDKIFWKK